ncbi:TenA family protein [Granulosicoccus sp. 3-233]|uniref:TenA family protein n=1 Tax=Granulosicoccus sp. 3-233 TaxID=3417969 RepID=UPI003D343A62
MSPTHVLQQSNATAWQSIAQHAFCRELAEGSLPNARMAEYLIQDYSFIDGFVRLAATAIAHAPTLKDSVPLAQFLAVITGPENTYFLRSFDALGVSEERWRHPQLWSVTQDFQAIMTEARLSGSYARMIAVLVVAEWSYLEWATPFNPPADTLPFYFAEWISLHAGPDFEGVVSYLRTQLDTVWATLDDTEQSHVEDIFSRTVALEQRFFDQAYQPD